MENDPNLRGIVFNQLADGMEIKGEVPWKHPARFWRDADDAQLISYVDSHYGTFSERNYRIAVTKVSDDRSYHPIREMFDLLPEWDGVKRAESILIDYLGAEDNIYVRAVTRKSLCAAYMRVHHPGIKFDTMIVLNGSQGIGKSTLIAKLGMEWFSDSLALSEAASTAHNQSKFLYGWRNDSLRQSSGAKIPKTLLIRITVPGESSLHFRALQKPVCIY